MTDIKKMRTKKSIFSGYLWFFVYLLVALASINLVFAMQAVAAETASQEKSRVSYSSGKMLAAEINADSKVLKGKNTATNKLRGTKGASTELTALNLNIFLHDFAIFDASTELARDIDEDGYFREFTLVFDADVDSGVAEVYAEIYLSRDGGPWLHHFTTDVFTIVGDSSEDQYEVNSSLVEGFPSDHYDILIDLYEPGFDEVVATYSSDDNNALYALPLEDATYDAVEVIVVYDDDHGGSFSWGLLFAGAVLLAVRRKMSARRG
ncbi:choice-of-anchor H family protein [Thalassomonas actiniarum]|uniref:Choice-of-anchor H family protein n=1 Tax=Thalassomonas actiniarum TaxID=485447 RepID=A0AAE9YUA8_9GAMM|nr:choice-of-anchor H family protein [Thalassomonas actiniarum]WDD99761.1 choice-of-anchor H family protein [Thalassomonas actiniarum]